MSNNTAAFDSDEIQPQAAITVADDIPVAKRSWTAWAWGLSAAAMCLAFLIWMTPTILLLWNTVSTDDAYVDGHVTMVAPRVSGQVALVHVDDNMQVAKGDILAEIDRVPFQVQVDIQLANVQAAETTLAQAKAEAHARLAEVQAARYALQHAIESVRDQIAQLHSNVAHWKVEQASLVLARRNYERNAALAPTGAVSQTSLDLNIAERDEALSRVEEAFEVIQQTRTNLGLPRNSENSLDVPEDLDQSFSLVREALANFYQSLAKLGYEPRSWTQTPNEAIQAVFDYKEHSNENTLYQQLLQNDPGIKQAEAQLLQAQRNLQQAELNLSYCTIVSEIDGIVIRRNVNPGNYIDAGQGILAVRSLEEIWINANFKETQLTNLRIGQPVDFYVDMYGGRTKFHGRISGFSMGTGQTLALLPAQNATGNFVKIVQRLPVRIEVLDYDPDTAPLYAGLSVEPYVFYKQPATGPNANKRLQDVARVPVSSDRNLEE
ncbi:HlyD family secretion protein [Bremerella alba]|uniref:p-hydroxybenzoic acid efflux pump subunit AaeA n=1 Tax=Bremerella alba TaxID=980252 RepID=A0A7V8V7G5_9BACT|nr:HlyD family secretion protein [Bremerella alba]MBA2116081.1 p-hydroxybenzoic acid efflux pump subunit AaeA [Bremerella alba]